MHNDDTSLYEPRRNEWLATLTLTGVTLALLAIAGYYTPAVLAAVIH